jgi:hypothetical protein
MLAVLVTPDLAKGSPILFVGRFGRDHLGRFTDAYFNPGSSGMDGSANRPESSPVLSTISAFADLWRSSINRLQSIFPMA